MQTNVQVPNFSQLVEYVTADYVIHPVPLTQQDLTSKLTLDAIKKDYVMLSEIKRPAELLSTKELDALKVTYTLGAKLTEVYPMDVVDMMLLKVGTVKEILPVKMAEVVPK